ncbi:cbb3-type cytochrome c oxidase subunit 3 [Roseobacter sp. HKCCA0434]|uniref:cbb3-type cytochrome c oxidase subunit 3 n=1 Tax=Roseobacter sp. HKCCA0434 TaxID=3079297 RepID=UPI002905DFF6|nr:cbb3-type cytochrome c oxidase subunit 3 [Roseobacter sp. HKCCA0434]
MDTYSFLRELADSWVLLILTLIFVGVILWSFRPGARPIHDDAAAVPFRHERPAAPVIAGCAQACEGCTCTANSTRSHGHG